MRVGLYKVCTISGSCPANVAATGMFTIPMMKKAGFKSEVAGAVEAVPLLGAVAFIIAEILEISYWSVCVAGFLPAVLFYLAEYAAAAYLTIYLPSGVRMGY